MQQPDKLKKKGTLRDVLTANKKNGNFQLERLDSRENNVKMCI